MFQDLFGHNLSASEESAGIMMNRVSQNPYNLCKRLIPFNQEIFNSLPKQI